ncbi:MAG TPA: class I SAM-dependent methyltransferase [Acidobacteriota bacterium]
MRIKKNGLTFSLKSIACPLCGGSGRRSVCTKFDLPISSCAGCGLVLADPRLPKQELMKRYRSKEFFAEYLAALNAAPDAYDLDHVRRHYSIPLGLLGRPPRSGARVLDAGCGPGFFIRAAAENGWAVEGVEVAEAAVVYARNVVGVPVQEGAFEEAVLPAGAYDAVTFLDILEHVRDPRAVLEKACRILRPGGKIVVSTPDYRSLSRLLLGRSWAVLSPAEHLYYFTAGTLKRLLAATGFDVRGVANLLVFNPNYTHAAGSRRHLRWRDIHARLERKSLAQRILMYEVRKILRLGNGRDKPASPPGAARAAVRKLYNGLRVLVRGDILFAVAVKKSL